VKHDHHLDHLDRIIRIINLTTGTPLGAPGPELEHQGQNGHARNEEGGGRGRTKAGAVEREGEWLTLDFGVFAFLPFSLVFGDVEPSLSLVCMFITIGPMKKL
jgi:hypothetical protein